MGKKEITAEHIAEFERLGELYRNTIYNSTCEDNPACEIVKKFYYSLKNNPTGTIGRRILGGTYRFLYILENNLIDTIRNYLESFNKNLKTELTKILEAENNGQLIDHLMIEVLFRQKSWESLLRKLILSYFDEISLEIYDALAFRIIVDADSTVSEAELEKICYIIKDICINFFTENLSCILLPPTKAVGNNPLIKDYIKNPKKNGYKSIHLAFKTAENPDNVIFECQIRTRKMDYMASSTYEQDHTRYKKSEYKEIIPYIHFDYMKFHNPHFLVKEDFDYETKMYKIFVEDETGVMAPTVRNYVIK